MELAQARKLAEDLMRLHKLLPKWSFKFDRSKVSFGKCYYAKKQISLSQYLVELNEEDEVRDTILHEIAHALTPGDGHGPLWKAMCVRIGANPARCYDAETVRSPARPAPKYRLGCQACDWWVDRRKLTRHRYICRRCRGKLVYQERVALAG